MTQSMFNSAVVAHHCGNNAIKIAFRRLEAHQRPELGMGLLRKSAERFPPRAYAVQRALAQWDTALSLVDGHQESRGRGS